MLSYQSPRCDRRGEIEALYAFFFVAIKDPPSTAASKASSWRKTTSLIREAAKLPSLERVVLGTDIVNRSAGMVETKRFSVGFNDTKYMASISL